MGFINKNANVILLLFIILSSTALVGATIFFQVNFEDINTEYNQKVQALQQISQELEQQEVLLDKVKGELSVKEEREDVLGEKFSEVKGQKESLETQKAQLEKSKTNLENELQSTESILRDAQSELESKKDQITQLESEVSDWESKYNAEKSRRQDAEDERDDCIAEKAQCTCP